MMPQAPVVAASTYVEFCCQSASPTAVRMGLGQDDEHSLAASEQACADGDQTLSLAHQTRSDGAQTRADRDQVASDRDQAASDRDQAASDLDQAASDLDLERGVVSTREHGCSREIRLRGTRQRHQTTQARLDAADKLREISYVRDLTARAQDARSRLS